MEGASAPEIAAVLGHKTLSMFVRYSSMDRNDAAEAMAKFSAFLEKETEITSFSTSQTEKGSGENA